jgi:heme/copper-type cytochrome/quinol oxidase subunit 2
MALATLLAQHNIESGDEASLAISILALIGMIVPFIVLGVVIWIFWKAKKREDAAKAREASWRSARSS